jgi:hypothetical protein
LGLSPFASSVTIREHIGSNKYDGINLSFDKRMSNRWSGKASYSYGTGRGDSVGGTGGANNPFQVGAERNLQLLWGPLAGDRTHLVSFAGVVEVPRTRGLKVSAVFRGMTGTPFTLSDSSVDVNMNGLTPDPLPAGTYSGTGTEAITVENKGGINGARGPGYKTFDMRAGYAIRLQNRRSLDLFVESFNLTNEPNFTNPSGDRRLSSFLQLQSLTGGGFPRAIQVGARLGF